MLYVKMIGGYLSLHCDRLHTKLWHYYTWNSRTWRLPMWIWMMYASAAKGIRTSWVSSLSLQRSCHCLGRYLGFATQLLFIKRESIVMLQNSKDCWSVQCRKHCCYGNQSCIIFCVSIIKTNIYICALLLWDYSTFEKHCSTFYLRINSLISDWVSTKIMISNIPDVFFGGLCVFTDGPSSIDGDRCLHY